jgi:hypothetical protein
MSLSWTHIIFICHINLKWIYFLFNRFWCFNLIEYNHKL